MLVCVVASLAFVSCSVREEVIINADGSGEAFLEVHLDPILISYYSDLMMAMTGATGDLPIFNLDQIRSAFAERPDITLVDAQSPERGTLALAVSFNDIAAAFSAEGEPDVLSFTRSGDRRELAIRLNRDTVNRFLRFAPPESNTITQFLFPPPDGSVSPEEYRDELAWALEEYASADEVVRILDAATIVVVVHPQGRLISQSGGTIEDASAVFRIPVLELLTLPREREYRVTFAP